MVNKHYKNNRTTETCQEPWNEYLARTSVKGYQSPGIVPDDEPLSQTECLLSLVDTLPSVAKSLASIDEGIWHLCSLLEAYSERVEAINEQNRLRADEEPPESTTNGSPPLELPPVDRGGKYVRL